MNSIILCALLSASYKVFAKVAKEYDEYEEITFYNIDDAPNLFKKYIKDFKKVYKDDTEYNNRLKIFTENLEYINRVALEAGQNIFILNEFADTETFSTGISPLCESMFLYIKSSNSQTNASCYQVALFT